MSRQCERTPKLSLYKRKQKNNKAASIEVLSHKAKVNMKIA